MGEVWAAKLVGGKSAQTRLVKEGTKWWFGTILDDNNTTTKVEMLNNIILSQNNLKNLHFEKFQLELIIYYSIINIQMFELSKNKKFVLIIMTWILSLIILWSFSFHLSEWWSILDSLYFTVITLTTIWYGDITPATSLWKILAMVYAVLWVPLFIWALSIIIESRMKHFILHHFWHHVRKIEKDEIKIQDQLNKEEIQLENIEKEVEKIESTISKKKESIFKKIIKKLK